MKRSLVILVLLLILIPFAGQAKDNDSIAADITSEISEALKEVAEALKDAQTELREALSEARKEMDAALGEVGKNLDFYLTDEDKEKLDKAKEEMNKMQDLLKIKQNELQQKIQDMAEKQTGKKKSGGAFVGQGGMGTGGMMSYGMMGGGMIGTPLPDVDQSDWEIKFYTFDKSMEPYMPLLKNILPHTSTFTFSEDLYSVAIFTSPAGQKKADDFIGQLLTVREEAREKRAEEKEAINAREKEAAASVQYQGLQNLKQQNQKSPAKGNVLLEILVLQGMPPVSASGLITISQDAKDMGMVPNDIRFLGSKHWQTYGKGIVSTGLNNEDFSTSISGCIVRGRLKAIDANSVNIDLDSQIRIVEVSEDKKTSRTHEARISSSTEFEIGQTTLLGTTSTSNTDTILIVIRANKTDGSTQKLQDI